MWGKRSKSEDPEGNTIRAKRQVEMRVLDSVLDQSSKAVPPTTMYGKVLELQSDEPFGTLKSGVKKLWEDSVKVVTSLSKQYLIYPFLRFH